MTSVFRQAMYDDLRDRLRDVRGVGVEVSGDAVARLALAPNVRMETLAYPALDLMEPLPDRLAGLCDLVVADQVLEHVPDPFRAAVSLVEMARPRGTVVVTAPCIFPPHDTETGDYWRFTTEGLASLFRRFSGASIYTGQWGNLTAATRALLWQHTEGDTDIPLDNDPRWPVVVWAVVTFL